MTFIKAEGFSVLEKSFRFHLKALTYVVLSHYGLVVLLLTQCDDEMLELIMSIHANLDFVNLLDLFTILNLNGNLFLTFSVQISTL